MGFQEWNVIDLKVDWLPHVGRIQVDIKHDFAFDVISTWILRATRHATWQPHSFLGSSSQTLIIRPESQETISFHLALQSYNLKVWRRNPWDRKKSEVPGVHELWDLLSLPSATEFWIARTLLFFLSSMAEPRAQGPSHTIGTRRRTVLSLCGVEFTIV